MTKKYIMKKALLIGINAYPSGNELHGCIEDINCLEKALARNGDGSLNFQVKKMPNVQSSGEVMDKIRELFNGSSDTALLYFSGHGYVNDTGAEIVMPDDLRDVRQYYKGLQMKDIMDVVNQSYVRNKIIIFDCCHAGNMGKYSIANSGSDLTTGVSMLLACREDESAEEMGGHGLFTELLCNALEGGAADPTGYITMGGIYAYIDRSFGAWGQRPVFKTNVTEFAPVKTVKPEVSLDEIKKITDLFTNINDDFALDPSFEFTNDPKEEHKVVEPYAIVENVAKFKTLQKLHGIGLVNPVGTPHMYFAAMNSKSCRLTELGKYFWRLVKDNKI